MDKISFLSQLETALQDIPPEKRTQSLSACRTYIEMEGFENEAGRLSGMGSVQDVADFYRSYFHEAPAPAPRPKITKSIVLAEESSFRPLSGPLPALEEISTDRLSSFEKDVPSAKVKNIPLPPLTGSARSLPPGYRQPSQDASRLGTIVILSLSLVLAWGLILPSIWGLFIFAEKVSAALPLLQKTPSETFTILGTVLVILGACLLGLVAGFTITIKAIIHASNTLPFLRQNWMNWKRKNIFVFLRKIIVAFSLAIVTIGIFFLLLMSAVKQ